MPYSALSDELTRREREVLELAAQGLTAPQIAQKLVIAEATAKQYFHLIYQKLGVGDRTLAVLEGIRRELIVVSTPH